MTMGTIAPVKLVIDIVPESSRLNCPDIVTEADWLAMITMGPEERARAVILPETIAARRAL